MKKSRGITLSKLLGVAIEQPFSDDKNDAADGDHGCDMAQSNG